MNLGHGPGSALPWLSSSTLTALLMLVRCSTGRGQPDALRDCPAAHVHGADRPAAVWRPLDRSPGACLLFTGLILMALHCTQDQARLSRYLNTAYSHAYRCSERSLSRACTNARVSLMTLQPLDRPPLRLTVAMRCCCLACTPMKALPVLSPQAASHQGEGVNAPSPGSQAGRRRQHTHASASQPQQGFATPPARRADGQSEVADPRRPTPVQQQEQQQRVAPSGSPALEPMLVDQQGSAAESPSSSGHVRHGRRAEHSFGPEAALMPPCKHQNPEQTTGCPHMSSPSCLGHQCRRRCDHADLLGCPFFWGGCIVWIGCMWC